MVSRASDSALIGIILGIPLFFGSVFLLIDLPIFNPVPPLSLAIAYLGLFFGLAFGVFAGSWYTKEQLRCLTIKHEYKGLGSKKIDAAIYVGLTIFLVFSFFILYFRTNVLAYALANGLILFVISDAFITAVIRFHLINSWERQEEKIVMMEWNKIYVIPYPPQF